MATLGHHAEVLKLARLLCAEPASLPFLDKLEASEIRTLRARITASLFDGDRHLFHRVASATRLLPAPVSALIAEKALGPLLCARVAGLLPAERAVDIARRLHTHFLADVCLELDPRHARELIATMPVRRIVEVADELSRRGEFITMARFVDVLAEPAMRATLEALRDNEALLRIGFFVEDPGQLGAVIELLPDPRLRDIVEVSVCGDSELWSEALALMNALPQPQRRRMAALAATLADEHVARMLRLTQEADLWPAMLPVVAEMDDVARKRLIRLPALQDDAVLAAMIVAADAGDMWPLLLPMVESMDTDLQQRAARVAGRHGAGLAARLEAARRTPAATDRRA